MYAAVGRVQFRFLPFTQFNFNDKEDYEIICIFPARCNSIKFIVINLTLESKVIIKLPPDLLLKPFIWFSNAEWLFA
jgi:hypothetical protein